MSICHSVWFTKKTAIFCYWNWFWKKEQTLYANFDFKLVLVTLINSQIPFPLPTHTHKTRSQSHEYSHTHVHKNTWKHATSHPFFCCWGICFNLSYVFSRSMLFINSLLTNNVAVITICLESHYSVHRCGSILQSYQVINHNT